jgi:LPXTG-motif cell wall-anchored protein
MQPEKKKNIWDILDAILEPAVQVYTDIRGNKTDGGIGNGGNPDDERPMPPPFQKCDDGFVLKDGKCVKETKGGSGTTLIVIGGVLVLGAAGYFLYKKFSNKPN